MDAFAAFDDQRVGFAPLSHGCEGVPHVRVILLREARGAVIRGWLRGVVGCEVVREHDVNRV